jgi:hypothetical protein
MYDALTSLAHVSRLTHRGLLKASYAIRNSGKGSLLKGPDEHGYLLECIRTRELMRYKQGPGHMERDHGLIEGKVER